MKTLDTIKKISDKEARITVCSLAASGKTILGEIQDSSCPGSDPGRKVHRTNSKGLWDSSQYGPQMEKGAAVFDQEGIVSGYEKKLSDLEHLLGKKEVEIVLLKNFQGHTK